MCIFKKWLPLFLFIIESQLLSGCHGGPHIPVETPTSGNIRISVDESFKPVIDSQLKVFESSFPDAKITVEYKSEADCLRDLSNDSTRLVIVTRGLTLAEEKFFKDSARTPAISGILAYDAVAMVVNNNSRDTLMSMDDVRSLLQGKDKLQREVVMDGVSATSTVRYCIDSVLRDTALGKNVVAAKTSPQVISYVENHPNAVGFIGVSWIGDTEDSTDLAFLSKIKVIAVRCDHCLDKPYVWPNQYNIYYRRYPMIRGLYYILKENYSGVGNNFINFLVNERGQLIFKRAYLMPARMNFEIRNVQMEQ
jgi:phosphate transport system substrate-binding protein